VYLNDILFEFNTSNPEQESMDDIDKVASILYKYPEATIRINGYADAIGSEKYNLKLSLQRANRIKEVIESRIEKTLRIITVPHGESDPVAVNMNADGSDNPEGRHYNRRVEIQFEGLPGTIHVIRVTGVPVALRHN
jgi:outer membrane protein OmpA-like peptidoglycan-associated protein